MDPSYLEYAGFQLVKIDLTELIKMKALLSKNFHIQPSEIDKMPMWEYEIFIDQLNQIVKEENDKQKKEMDKYHVDEYMKMASPKNISKMTQPQPMPKMSIGSPLKR